jgi:hypothetical protein
MWFRKNFGLLLFLYLCAPLMVMAQEAPALHEITRVRSEPDGRFFVYDVPAAHPQALRRSTEQTE